MSLFTLGRRSNSKGFTLLEVLVAMAIFAMIALYAYRVLNQVMQADKVSQGKSARLAELQQAMLTIERDMLQLTNRQVRFPAGEKQASVLKGQHFFLDSEDDGLLFTRRGWQNPAAMLPRSEVQLAAYRLAEGKLIKDYHFYPDPEVGAEPQSLVLLTKVEAFKVRYFDGDSWQESWDASELPRAIELRLKLKDYGEITRRFAIPGPDKDEAKGGSKSDGQSGNPGIGLPGQPHDPGKGSGRSKT
ncbi:type II secretion system minor pseudopilin GspJ [Gallaecimonas kandeliae]|uniref:type II secretion system minor pseudopilin GspJ n=1 Tax=Gallaecimonas kandeliae TaxID=3029055 RepID=UPI0026497DDE|nr:type II secretion system minor pseudopilin GspJ [Gallaecimonas kandeliae]WKE65920.1 type II secretion system minor pseudopilin GspJ [Gallaecimonas kandeliae]